MKRITYILLFVAVAHLALAQQQVMKVVTRVVEKEYRFQKDFLLEIDAEKADIDIKVTDGHSVKVYLKQVVRNTDLRVAENELKAIRFAEKKERNRLYLHNYTQLQANSMGLTSRINNKYTIEVPRFCHLKIKNELGGIVINGVSSSMRFNLNYCTLVLNDATGKLYVDSRIGDITLNDCNLDGEFVTEIVNIKLQRVGGSFDFQALFGTLSCLMTEQVSMINASLEQCEATLINRSNINFSYAVEVNKAYINVLDEELKEKVIEDINKSVLQSRNDSDFGTVIIKSEYSDVNLY